MESGGYCPCFFNDCNMTLFVCMCRSSHTYTNTDPVSSNMSFWTVSWAWAVGFKCVCGPLPQNRKQTQILLTVPHSQPDENTLSSHIRHCVAADREASISSREEVETRLDQIKPLQVGSVPSRGGQMEAALVSCLRRAFSGCRDVSARQIADHGFGFKWGSWTLSLPWLSLSKSLSHSVSIKYWTDELWDTHNTLGVVLPELGWNASKKAQTRMFLFLFWWQQVSCKPNAAGCDMEERLNTLR